MENNEVHSVRVYNRDIPVLTKYLYFVRAIEKLEDQIMWEHDRKINVSQHITGMPNGKGGVNGLDNVFARIDALEQEHREMVDRYIKNAKKVDKILNGIESLTMRMFVRMKYMEDMSDTDIRKSLNLSRRGFDLARRSVESAPNMASVKWPERYIIINE